MKSKFRRGGVVITTLILFGLLSWVIIYFAPEKEPELKLEATISEMAKDMKVERVDPKSDPSSHALQAKQDEIDWRFNQAVAMLHAKQYDYAIKALHRLLELAPKMPEAHVNMGFAFLGGGDIKSARDFFNSALEINPKQLNAYYGLAMAAEAQQDMEVALGAMRTYVHLSSPDDPYLKKARAALWEWQEARDKETQMYQAQESDMESDSSQKED